MIARAYIHVIDPVNLMGSVPPNVSSPFFSLPVVVGSKGTATSSTGIVPWLNRLSVTVGIGVFVSGDNVPTVKSTGPILGMKSQCGIQTEDLCAHPRIPSKPLKPLEVEATPIDWLGMTSPGPIVTVSVYLVPKKSGSWWSKDEFHGEKHTRE